MDPPWLHQVKIKRVAASPPCCDSDPSPQRFFFCVGESLILKRMETCDTTRCETDGDSALNFGLGFKYSATEKLSLLLLQLQKYERQSVKFVFLSSSECEGTVVPQLQSECKKTSAADLVQGIDDQERMHETRSAFLERICWLFVYKRPAEDYNRVQEQTRQKTSSIWCGLCVVI